MLCESQVLAAVTVQQVRVLLNAGLSTEVIRSLLPCARGRQPGFDWCADLRAILEGELSAMDKRLDDFRRTSGALADHLVQP